MNSKIIVLIDDLDRCSEENAIRLLDSIKLFFDTQNIIIVIAADLSMLETAWEIKFRYSTKFNSKKYLDKIFQLKISLPPKHQVEVDSFIDNITKSLPNKILLLFKESCPRNPRMIIKINNAIYFNARLLDEQLFHRQFPLLVIWSIINYAYDEIADNIKKYPIGLLIISYIISNYEDFEEFFFSVDRDEYNRISNTIEIKIGDKMKLGLRYLDVHVTDCLIFIQKNRRKDLFNTFRSLGNYFAEDFTPLRSYQSNTTQIPEIIKLFKKDVETIVYQVTL